MSSAEGRGAWLLTLTATAILSAALHAGGLALAARLEPPRLARPAPVLVEFEAVSPPERVQEPQGSLPPSPPPPPRHQEVLRRPPPPRAPKPPPLPSSAEPPAPEPPRADSPPARAAPRVGISLSSTTSSGAFAVGVGNTLFGKAPEVATDPREVNPEAPAAPATPGAAGPFGEKRPSVQPRLLEQPEVPYPASARHAGVEGQVKLLLSIDRQGHVASARVLTDPGEGLGEAARSAALRFRFSPGVLDGEPVEVKDFVFTYTFVLE